MVGTSLAESAISHAPPELGAARAGCAAAEAEAEAAAGWDDRRCRGQEGNLCGTGKKMNGRFPTKGQMVILLLVILREGKKRERNSFQNKTEVEGRRGKT